MKICRICGKPIEKHTPAQMAACVNVLTRAKLRQEAKSDRDQSRIDKYLDGSALAPECPSCNRPMQIWAREGAVLLWICTAERKIYSLKESFSDDDDDELREG